MPKQNKFKTYYAFSLAWELGFVIIVQISLSIFIGIKIDQFTNLSPIFLIIFSLLGIVTTTYSVYHVLKPIIHND